MMTTANEFNFHRTKVDDNGCTMTGGLEKGPFPISDFDTAMRILKMPQKDECPRYKNNWRVEYNVTCPDGQLAYWEFTSFDMRGADCNGRCRDYVQIDYGSTGKSVICDKDDVTDNLDADGSFNIVFRTGECNNDGKKWVHYKEDRCNQYHQCKRKDVEDETCSCYHEGFAIYAICFNNETEEVDEETGRRKRFMATTTTTDTECGNKKSEVAEDLANFQNQWQRMSQNPGAELIEDFVLHQHTVTYKDNTIIIMDALNGSIVARYEKVRILSTFDSNGVIKRHVGGVRGRQEPHFNRIGPLVIVCNCAFFEMFEIDPRGLLPNEAEKIELRKMYAPFLNMSDHDEETSNVIINQIYSGDDREQNRTRRAVSQDNSTCTIPTISGEDCQIMEPNRLSLCCSVFLESTRPFDAIELEAVIAAHRNKDICNPVLRAQSSATLSYYNRINENLVECLSYFSCSVIMN
jgi:hypothetical protein